MMPPADRLLIAFVGAFSSNDGYAVLRARGGSPGYVHVVPAGFDPTRPWDRHLLVERYNGTVGVTEALKDTLQAQPRPAEPITTDPLGYAAGSNFGRLKWALTHDAILKTWGSERAFADNVAQMLRGLHERGGGDDEGDYARKILDTRAESAGSEGSPQHGRGGWRVTAASRVSIAERGGSSAPGAV